MSDKKAALAKMKLRRDQLSARIKDAEAREKTKVRKADARRKIILGGALLRLLINSEDLSAQRVYGACKDLMSDKDKSLFSD